MHIRDIFFIGRSLRTIHRKKALWNEVTAPSQWQITSQGSKNEAFIVSLEYPSGQLALLYESNSSVHFISMASLYV